ncbi:MAG: WG repeat-containing protein [Reichenbachiella sp.]
MIRVKGLGGMLYLSIVLFLSNLTFQSFSQGTHSIFEEDGKFGLKDSEDKVLIRPRFDKLGWSKGLNIPTGEVIGYYDDAWGLVSLKDRNITAPKYYSLEAIHKDLILASLIGRFSNELIYGAINSRGETIIDFNYHSISKVKDLLIVSERKKARSVYGLYNEQNVELLPLGFKSIRPFNNDLFVFENDKDRKGIIHKSGKKLIEASLDSIAPINNGRYFVFDHGKIGVLGSTGSFIKKPVYKSITEDLETSLFQKIEIRSGKNHQIVTFDADSIKAIGNKNCIVFTNGYATIYDGEFKQLATVHQYESHQLFRSNIVVKSSNGYQIINAQGKYLSKGHYQEVKYDDHYIYVLQNENWSIYNSFGRKVTNKPYQNIIPHSTNLIPVKRKKYWGYIDNSGNRAISFKYDSASEFIGQLAQVKYLGYNMLINQFGNQLGESSYDRIEILTPDLVKARKKSRTDLINGYGKTIFQTFNKLENHPLGFIEKTEDGDVGLISNNGEIIFDPIFSDISEPFYNKYLIVKKPGKVGIAQPDGSMFKRMSDEYEDLLSPHHGMIGIKENGKWGFVNFKNQLIIANRYDSVKVFQGEIAAVYLGGHWGFIDRREKLVVQPNLDEIGAFYEDYVLVARKDLMGVINLKGEFILNVEYDHIERMKNGNLLARKNDKFGVFDATGKQLLPVSYSYIELTKGYQYIVSRRNLYGVTNNKGRFEIPLKFRGLQELRKGEYLCSIFSQLEQ